jgi:O-antigen/teichoic acid export membrane protein
LTIFGFVHAIAYAAVVARFYRGVPSRPSPVGRRELVAYSLPLGATDIVGVLSTNLDMWLIVLMFPAESVALYRMGAWQIPILTTVAYSVGAVQLTRFTTLFQHGQGEQVLRIWRETTLKVALLVIPASAVFIVGAEEFVTIAFTADYVDSAPIFRAYCFLTLARVTAFGTLLTAAGRPGAVLSSSIFSLVANLVLSVPLLLLLGFVGPALGTTLAFIPTLVFYNLAVARAFDVSLAQTFPLLGLARIAAVAAVPVAGAVAFKLAFDWGPVPMFLGETAIVLGGWAALGSAVGLIGRQEWRFVSDFLGLKVLRDP